MSFRGWGQIIKPWLLRSLTRYAVQPLFVRFSWKHWNVLTLPSCGKQNRNFVYIRETHTHTGEKAHETKCSAVALIHHTQTHTYRRYSLLIWSLVGCFSFICRLFLFVINMTNIVSYYSVAWNRKQKFLFFLLFCLYCPIDFCVTVQTRSAISLSVLFSTFLYLLFETKKKIARADVRLTGPAKTCSQLPNNWSGSGTAAISSDLFIYFYQCSIARSNFYLRKIFKSRLFLFFSFLSFSLSSSSGWQYRL